MTNLNQKKRTNTELFKDELKNLEFFDFLVYCTLLVHTISSLYLIYKLSTI